MTKISIVMPAYNAEEYIEESIISVQNQTYKNWELIVIDDGSKDNTRLIVNKLIKEDTRIKYYYQENRKLGAARNSALKVAKGDWIGFLDSDDIWMYDKLETQIKLIESDDNIDVVFTQGYFLFDDNKDIKPYDSLIGKFCGKEIYKLQMINNYIPVLSVIVKKRIIDLIGLQDETPLVYGCEDWDYWIRMAKAGAIFYGLDDRLFKYRIHENGMSQNRILMKCSTFNTLHKNLDLSLIDSLHKNKVISSLINLARSIVVDLYDENKFDQINNYLLALLKLTGNLKFIIASRLLYLLEGKSKKIVIFILFH